MRDGPERPGFPRRDRPDQVARRRPVDRLDGLERLHEFGRALLGSGNDGADGDPRFPACAVIPPPSALGLPPDGIDGRRLVVAGPE